MRIEKYLATCRELTQLCTQNGWIDNDTLRFEVDQQSPAQVTGAVSFEEVVMEGSGCVATRVSCHGRVRLRLDEAGEVKGLELL